jgi:hypothetical protein
VPFGSSLVFSPTKGKIISFSARMLISLSLRSMALEKERGS